MGVLGVEACPHDFEKYIKMYASFWKSGLVGRPISRDDAWAETPPASHVSGHIHLLRLSEKRIAADRIAGIRVAVIAAAHGVDEVAAEAYQCPVLLNKVEFDRRDRKSTPDPRFVVFIIALAKVGPINIPVTTTVMATARILQRVTSSLSD
jgi:hypothetical protein